MDSGYSSIPKNVFRNWIDLMKGDYPRRQFTGMSYPSGGLRTGAKNTLVSSRRVKKNRKGLKNKILSLEPTKHYANASATALVSSAIYSVFPTVGIVQGTSGATRIGDSIELCALKIKGYYSSAATAGAYSFRIIVGYTGEEYNFPATLNNSGITAAEMFINNTPTNWATNGIINAQAFTCIFDQTMDVNSQIAATSDLSSYSFTVPLNKHFAYQSQGGVFGKYKNLCIAVVSDVVGGSGGSTSTGQTVLAYDLIYK